MEFTTLDSNRLRKVIISFYVLVNYNISVTVPSSSLVEAEPKKKVLFQRIDICNCVEKFVLYLNFVPVV